MVEKKEKVLKGIVKAVISGDYITLSRSTKTSGHTEQNVNLASVQAPKIGSTNRVEEPFAFEAREFLREKIIGKKAEFHTDYSYGGRDYGTLIIDGKNYNLEIIKAGLAKVIEKKGSMQASAQYEELSNAQADAKNRKVGLWASTDEKFLEKHTRKVTYFTDAGYNAGKILEEAKSIDKPLESVVEYVFNASYLSVYVHRF